MQHNAREFQDAWGEIISGDLDAIEDHVSYSRFSRFVRDEGLFQHIFDAADIFPTLEHLSDCALSAGSHMGCLSTLSLLRNCVFFSEIDFLQHLLTSTDPNIQEAAALRLTIEIRRGSSHASVLPARLSVTNALADLFCNFEMKSLDSKTTLSELLSGIMLDFGRNCSPTSQKVLPCALRVLRTASLDPDASEYVGSSLGAVAHILQNYNILDINYMPILDPRQFRSFFSDLICSPGSSWDVINSILALPREKLGDTDLTSLFLQPEVLDALRHAFVRTCDDGGSSCGWILDMWHELVVLEPSAAMKMIRLDFLGDTILHMVSSDESFDDAWERNASFLGKVPSLMDEMLDVSMQDTIDYFFNRGFCKNLATAIKLPSHLMGLPYLHQDFVPLRRVIRCFEIAVPPVRGSVVTASIDNKQSVAATPSVESPAVPAAPSDRFMADDRPSWAYDPTYDQLVTPVLIDNLEAFAAASGNMYVAAFFMELLTPTSGDEALSHDEQWRWLTNPNPVCLAVMRHLLHNKPATKKALFAAAGIHELSRNARDFEPRPDDPTRSYYRDEDGNDVCERPQ